jgi:hypothetical protein
MIKITTYVSVPTIDVYGSIQSSQHWHQTL